VKALLHFAYPAIFAVQNGLLLFCKADGRIGRSFMGAATESREGTFSKPSDP
jgi:hypothetical protein